MVINIDSAEWSAEEIEAGVAVLRKIAHCYDTVGRIPGKVYEAHLRSKKNISTEMVVFNERGEVYLIERPPLEENPSEPFPGELHSPGVTHLQGEFTEPDTFNRLVRSEFGGRSLRMVQKAEELDHSEAMRGMYRLIIYVGMTDGEPVNPRGRFYGINEIPWDRLVASHREVVVPAGIRHFLNSATFRPFWPPDRG